jgi:hypothetical protein
LFAELDDGVVTLEESQLLIKFWVKKSFPKRDEPHHLIVSSVASFGNDSACKNIFTFF